MKCKDQLLTELTLSNSSSYHDVMSDRPCLPTPNPLLLIFGSDKSESGVRTQSLSFELAGWLGPSQRKERAAHDMHGYMIITGHAGFELDNI